MKCPNDDATLVMSERAGVEIDYCPVCRGIWLDRGELDKILDRATAELAAGPSTPAAPWEQQPRPEAFPPPRRDPMPPQPGYGGYQEPYREDRRRPRKRREHWLSELFDD
ncbi:TFIIB-type zinc ribbon-containing protein [Occultella gossypii]|uniref:Zf-TFIIB domain-containing protein n=1 Tax=Occultella gossypii TaxID=2800820 RepID=A0ABS7S9K9_9MICO|nr:zf-TFIIB domain-containing protein [Occultella gossypii]MBZ2197027.1 zf-TFIIB domain-containing protein [Occultella gossypii]